MKKVVIIGRNGQVAWELQQEAPKDIELLVLGSKDIDILNAVELDKSISEFIPDVIINASAYTAVDKAETDELKAYEINELAVRNLANLAKKLDCRLIHISTDFVFDGKKNTAYKVDERTNPVSVYGASKLAGEKAIQSLYPEGSTIVRTSWVYSSHGNNFVKTMLRLMQEKEELNIVADQIGCPTYAKGLAQFLWILAEQDKINPIYNWSDLGASSWYDFALAIQEQAYKVGLLNKEIPISPITSSQYPTPARRPKFSLLDLSENNQNIGKAHWRTHLMNCLSLIKQKA